MIGIALLIDINVAGTARSIEAFADRVEEHVINPAPMGSVVPVSFPALVSKTTIAPLMSVFCPLWTPRADAFIIVSTT
jgi:hypothetical protein